MKGSTHHLAAPLLQNQVVAANRLYHRLEQWRLSDATLSKLREGMPSFNDEACLLKSLAINQLYGTQIKAIIPLALHVSSTLRGVDPAARGIGLVDDIALFVHNGRSRRQISFASKFCHFFVDKERFPIYDGAAQRALKFHLGARYLEHANRKYAAFYENFQRLRAVAGIQGSVRELDHYLWIVGMYIRWKRDPRINAELRRAFEHPTRDQLADLYELLPRSLRS
jgi:hypothetical protein